MKSAVIYARVSSTTERQNTDRQLSDLNAYAISNNYTVFQTFTEHISGAKKNSERDVLCECLDYCIKNSINTLLISELSRLGRNVDEVLANVRKCKENKLNIFFQKEQLNTYNANGSENPFLTIMLAVLGTCAQMERENIAYRLSSGRKLAIERGVKMGRKVGYRKPKEDKKEQYKEVIKYLKKGLSVANVLKCCKSDGIKVSERTIWSLKREFC